MTHKIKSNSDLWVPDLNIQLPTPTSPLWYLKITSKLSYPNLIYKFLLQTSDAKQHLLSPISLNGPPYIQPLNPETLGSFLTTPLPQSTNPEPYVLPDTFPYVPNNSRSIFYFPSLLLPLLLCPSWPSLQWITETAYLVLRIYSSSHILNHPSHCSKCDLCKI